jgi:adenylate kinase
MSLAARPSVRPERSRERRRKLTCLGIAADATMKAGKLVPDAMMLRLILNELGKRGWIDTGPVMPYTLSASSFSTHDLAQDPPVDAVPHEYTYSDAPTASFILDGFPRNAAQARQIERLIPINLAVSIRTPADIVLERIAGRWVHAPSGRVYNTGFDPPRVPGRDDVTGEPLTRRPDDDPAVWRERLEQFDRASESLLEFYERKGLLWTVKGNSSDEISPKLFAEFERRFL